MKIAIMQPYFLPYIGYIQLINAVDKFVIYDDVNFIKGGWINRNNLLVNNQKYLFTIPLSDSSSFKKIDEIHININLYSKWHKKILRSIEQSYKKAPFFDDVYCLLENILEVEGEGNISEFIYKSLVLICKYIGIDTQIIKSSRKYDNTELDREDRIFDICKKEECNVYINPIGGIELYGKEHFSTEGIKLEFLQSRYCEYSQFNNEFIPWLSIIDVMMFNDKENIKKILEEFDLV